MIAHKGRIHTLSKYIIIIEISLATFTSTGQFYIFYIINFHCAGDDHEVSFVVGNQSHTTRILEHPGVIDWTKKNWVVTGI